MDWCRGFNTLDWCATVERYKSSRYQPLRGIMTEALPRSWSVKQINLTIGIRSSFAETQWTAALASLGVSATGATLSDGIPNPAVPDGTEGSVPHTSRCTAAESGCTTVTIEQIPGRVADRTGPAGSADSDINISNQRWPLRQLS